MKKRKPKVRLWIIVTEAVTRGVAYGYRHAHKHTENPPADFVEEEIERAVMGELADIIDFD